ncbi:DGQHR domain-containing protein [Cytobacillus firmus]|uniref:DGQHR domain-containing protein n=1 Tax=Cytobacillus firmus TaxID=1399 RepID=UPI00384A4AF7
MVDYLPSYIAIENVLQFKIRGRVAYQGVASSDIALIFSFSKPFNHPSGKGYQRPISKKRCKDFASYLSKGDDSLYTPILLNGRGYWEFQSYDKTRPNLGRLLCKKKASLMDGQHRLSGIGEYVKETNSILNVPFLAFHFLDEDEEIKFFDVINTKAKGIGTSLSRYLNRDNDDISWVATQLVIMPESPFYKKGTLIGKRSRGKHITLQNLFNLVNLLIKDSKLQDLPKEKILGISLFFFTTIKETLPEAWEDYTNFKLTHIVGLKALSLVGNEMLKNYYSFQTNQIDSKRMVRKLLNLKVIDWSTDGGLKYIKGNSGAKLLANDILNCL